MNRIDIGKAVGALLIAVLAVVAIGYIGDAVVPIGGEGEDRVATTAQEAGAAGAAGEEDMAKKSAEEVAEAHEEEGETEVAEVAVPGLDLSTADVAAGKKLFKKCRVCHTVGAGGRNRIGPNLFGIVGRPVGSHAGFRYSGAMAGLGGTWTLEALDAFLTKPKDFLAGSKMKFAGLGKAQDRADLLAYLATLTD